MPLLPRIAALALVLVSSAALGALHPMDGPDVDLRIQITDDRVTASVTFNLAFADEIVYAPRETPDALHEVEAPALAEALFAFIRDENRVTIDGVEVTPALREYEVPEPQSDLLPLFPLSGMRALLKVHLIVDYPAKSPPEVVTFRWGEFPLDTVRSTPDDQLPVIIAGQFSGRGASWIVEFTRENPEYTWRRADTPTNKFEEVPAAPTPRRLGVPVASLALGAGGLLSAGIAMVAAPRRRRGLAAVVAVVAGLGGALLATDVGVVEVEHPLGPGVSLTDDQAMAVFRPLHANIYRAFDYNEESDIYDALARSVSGGLLDELYNQIYQGLVMQLEDGAAVSRVQHVEPVETKLIELGVTEVAGEPEASFSVEHRWRVTGAVYHWGHSHTRTNEYRAEYTVAGTPDGWRITASRPLEQFRVDSVPGDPGGVFQYPEEL
ncbi:MAG: hypothetical protein ACF8R7_06065 [Phycisphaerales bacterium JB039]